MPSGYGDIGKKQGGGDPNILKLKDTNQVRPLDNVVAGWRQHGIEHPSDPDQFASVVCPGPRSCPLCRKPVDAQGKQRFPVSRRYGANVWSYTDAKVKVLIGGPSIFDEFKKVATVGIDPGSCDWTIAKSGQGIKTSYDVIRHEAAPFTAATVGPEQLHDVAKYEQPASPEAIFEILEKFGINYDALDTPSYTEAEALAFTMPYGKHKGLTIEQLLAQEADYASFIHGSKLEQGSLGDPVFLALQTAMEARDLVPSLDDLDQLPTEAAAVAAPAVIPPAPGVAQPAAADTVQLVTPDGELKEFPANAADALVAAGFTRWEPPAEEPAPPAVMTVLIGGNAVELPAETAAGLLASGQAEPVDEAAEEPTPPVLPLPDEQVRVDVAGTEVSMAFVQAAQLVEGGTAEFVDHALQLAFQDHLARAAAQPDPSPTQSPSSASTATDPDKPYRCPLCEKSFKTQGALTQHSNREHKAAEPQPSAIPAASNGGGDLADEVKALVSRSPFSRDFDRLLSIMKEETGTDNFAALTEPQLRKFKTRVEAEIAAAK